MRTVRERRATDSSCLAGARAAGGLAPGPLPRSGDTLGGLTAPKTEGGSSWEFHNHRTIPFTSSTTVFNFLGPKNHCRVLQPSPGVGRGGGSLAKGRTLSHIQWLLSQGCNLAQHPTVPPPPDPAQTALACAGERLPAMTTRLSAPTLAHPVSPCLPCVTSPLETGVFQTVSSALSPSHSKRFLPVFSCTMASANGSSILVPSRRP